MRHHQQQPHRTVMIMKGILSMLVEVEVRLEARTYSVDENGTSPAGLILLLQTTQDGFRSG